MRSSITIYSLVSTGAINVLAGMIELASNLGVINTFVHLCVGISSFAFALIYSRSSGASELDEGTKTNFTNDGNGTD